MICMKDEGYTLGKPLTFKYIYKIAVLMVSLLFGITSISSVAYPPLR